MQHAYRIVLSIHVALGSVALLAFWAAVFARKGGVSHRRLGQLFVGTMTSAVLTALALCVAVNVYDPFFIRPPTESLSPQQLAEYPQFIRGLFDGIAGGGVFALLAI